MFAFDTDYDPVGPAADAVLAEIGLDARSVRDVLADDLAPLSRPRGPGGRELEEGFEKMSGTGLERAFSGPAARPSSTSRTEGASR